MIIMSQAIGAKIRLGENHSIVLLDAQDGQVRIGINHLDSKDVEQNISDREGVADEWNADPNDE